jgi:hypothetical protein
MPTVQEILKQSGLNDEQIAALDAKAITAFTGVLSAAEQERQTALQASQKAEQERQAAAEAAAKAEQERQAATQAQEAAEVAQRSNRQFYDESIAPALNNWGNEKANLEAQLAFLKAQNEAGRAAGFIPAEAPAYQTQNLFSSTDQSTQPRDSQGRYVANAPGGTPGSPTFTMEAIDQRLGNGISNIGWAMQEYQRLSGGQFLPDSFDKLSEEATNARLPFRDYVARKYDFSGKEAAVRQKVQQEHDAKVAAEATAPYEAKLAEAEKARQKAIEETDRKWAEKIGSNPDVKIAQPSRFTEVSRAVKSGDRPDPLALNEQQRRQATSQAIKHEIAEQQVAA